MHGSSCVFVHVFIALSPYHSAHFLHRKLNKVPLLTRPVGGDSARRLDNLGLAFLLALVVISRLPLRLLRRRSRARATDVRAKSRADGHLAVPPLVSRRSSPNRTNQCSGDRVIAPGTLSTLADSGADSQKELDDRPYKLVTGDRYIVWKEGVFRGGDRRRVVEGDARAARVVERCRVVPAGARVNNGPLSISLSRSFPPPVSDGEEKFIGVPEIHA